MPEFSLTRRKEAPEAELRGAPSFVGFCPGRWSKLCSLEMEFKCQFCRPFRSLQLLYSGIFGTTGEHSPLMARQDQILTSVKKN